MLFALPVWAISEALEKMAAKGDAVKEAAYAAKPAITLKMLLALGLPAVFDLSSVLLMMAGLSHISASVWMLLRGGCIVFVAFMKQFVLGDALTLQMWVGVATITVAVLLVGAASTLPTDDGRRRLAGDDDAGDGADDAADAAAATTLGVLLTLAGTFMQSLQYVYEEKMMTGDAPAPPWLLIGMEGLFGTLLTVLVVYPLAGMVPGNNHGVFEDLDNTLAQLESNPALLQLSIAFCVLVFILNSFSVLVTFMLSSVWHAILDNFRPITIWAVELFIYYGVSGGQHGERWTSPGSYLQLLGLAIMLLGTAIYNGTVALPGLPGSSDLLASDDERSTPAMSRSPLLTRSPQAEFLSGGARSPYAKRAEMGGEDPMQRGGDGLKDGLLKKIVVDTKGSGR